MAKKAEKYSFLFRKKKLCPLCLEELKGSAHVHYIPKGKVLVKRRNYALVNISKDEPIIKRMLEISNNKKDGSKEFILLYVDSALVGYKGADKIKFIFGSLEEEYRDVLRDYVPKEKKEKSSSKIMWKEVKKHIHSNPSQTL